ncbi:Telomeric repeat-binding factor 2-interacting protein 1 [Madurella mycetomatis]|uniref:Telomeric repeat-binding factor 2-interacting protein 1 n=1 Tax=Madurella mycetomatis TaxID=100816 RepID=A0A175VT97_9PEZI|nr:Telomeric repeat-binding factor 2-interacting protein 1 [Madurella mycetomatis]
MAANIVYEGVNGKYEGTLFGGVKFWVAQRVPTRQDILNKIKVCSCCPSSLAAPNPLQENGGKIVVLEKFADVLIADHAKKNAPPGSVSWKYIDDSVRQGAIANIDDYRIGSVNPTQKPAKGGKVPFTNQDDQILVGWVRQHAHNRNGNKIYQDLEKQHPHHSWQSWRDRWVKRLAFLQERDLPAPLQTPVPPRPRSVIMPEAIPAAAPPAAAPPATAVQRTGSLTEGAPEEVQTPDTSRGRVFFTEEDDKLLTNYVLQRRRDNRKEVGRKYTEKGMKIYTDLADQYPHHTAHSWRDRWVRYLSLREPENSPDLFDTEKVRPKPRAEPPLTQPPPTDLPPSASQLTRTVAKREQRHSTSPQSSLPPPAPQSSGAVVRCEPRHSVNPLQGNDRLRMKLRELEDKRRRIQAARLIQRVWRGSQARWRVQRRFKVLKIRRDKLRAAATIKRIWRGYRVRRDYRRTLASITSFQARANGYLTRQALAEESDYEIKNERDDSPSALDQLPFADCRSSVPGETVFPQDGTNEPPPHQCAAKTGLTPVLTRECFWEFFNHDRETTGASLVPWAQIGRRTVDFWSLWSCATREPHHESRDWELIAESLGYDWVAEPDVPRLVKEAYEEHLLEFECAMQAFDGWDEGESDDEEEVDEGHYDIDGEDEEDNVSQETRDIPAHSVDQDLFESSPPLVSYKRTFKQAIRSSSISYASSVSKRRRRNPNEEVPCTPESHLSLTGQENDGSKMPSPSQDTPSNRPRLVARLRKLRAELETQGFSFGNPALPGRVLEPETQNFDFAMQDGGLEDDEAVSASEHLQSETEEPHPNQKIFSSANRPLPTIDHNDALSESSDEFETMRDPKPRPSSTSRPALSSVAANAYRRRRTLPASWSKGKQPASVIADISPPPPRRPTIVKEEPSSPAQPVPPPSARNRSGGLSSTNSLTPQLPPAARSVINPPPSSSTNPNPKSAKQQVFDPSPIINYFVVLGYPASIVSRAVKATTCRQVNTAEVIESLERGDGIPRSMKGVWTEGDDRRVREIAGWLDALGGLVPDKSSTPGGWEERVFWRLAEKHEVEGVLERRQFLKVWDSI